MRRFCSQSVFAPAAIFTPTRVYTRPMFVWAYSRRPGHLLSVPCLFSAIRMLFDGSNTLLFSDAQPNHLEFSGKQKRVPYANFASACDPHSTYSDKVSCGDSLRWHGRGGIMLHPGAYATRRRLHTTKPQRSIQGVQSGCLGAAPSRRKAVREAPACSFLHQARK